MSQKSLEAVSDYLLPRTDSNSHASVVSLGSMFMNFGLPATNIDTSRRGCAVGFCHFDCDRSPVRKSMPDFSVRDGNNIYHSDWGLDSNLFVVSNECLVEI